MMSAWRIWSRASASWSCFFPFWARTVSKKEFHTSEENSSGWPVWVFLKRSAGILLVMIVALISAALDSILLAALYLYATEGAVPQHFNDELLHDAFARRG
jgi:hypothetical protein